MAACGRCEVIANVRVRHVDRDGSGQKIRCGRTRIVRVSVVHVYDRVDAPAGPCFVRSPEVKRQRTDEARSVDVIERRELRWGKRFEVLCGAIVASRRRIREFVRVRRRYKPRETVWVIGQRQTDVDAGRGVGSVRGAR